MGVQTPSSIDNPRTHWTPAMDRYFINLMLEEVQKGSRVDDHLFSKQGWSNMTALFNAKFGSQYDKDVLKNRQKTLRKLYKSVRKLLDESGFNWDSTLQMVSANDDVWDNYIKAHPDARSYRTKTVPYYNDLCTIYKNEMVNMDHDSNLENCSQETKVSELLEDPISPVTSKVQETSSLLRNRDDEMVNYPETNIGDVLDDSRSSAITDIYGDLIGNVEVDIAYDHNMHVSMMPTSDPRTSDDEEMMDLSRMEISGILESPKSLAPSLLNKNQVRSVQEPSTQLAVDVDANTGEGMVCDKEIRANEISDDLKSSTISEAKVDQLNKSSSNSGIGIEISDQQSKQEPSSDEQNKQQESVTTTFEPSSIEKCMTETDEHEALILADKGASENPISIRNGIDELQDSPNALNTASGIYRLRTNWTPRMDLYFIDLMLDQVREGNMIDGAGRKQAWKNMISLFNSKFGFQYDAEILKNRYKTLRKHYNAVTFLLDQPGFIWDDTRKMVTADDFVWHDYLKTHPGAGQYRTRIMPYYNDLCAIYRDASSPGHNPNPNNNISSANNDKGSFNQQNKRKLTTPLTHHDSKKIRSCDDDKGMADALREMATAVYSLADKKKETSNIFSIENAINALQSLPDMDDELLLDACDFLEDEKKGKTFLALDVSLRKKWLIRKLRS